MRNAIRLFSGLTALLLATAPAKADTTTAGLWVGEVTLTGVNEAVNGVNAANVVVSPDPAVTTPVATPAHMRIILLADTNGAVSLLKSVALVSVSSLETNTVGTNTVVATNSSLVMLTDPSTYSQYGSQPGQRLTAVAYDFGDGTNAQYALNRLAAAVASAAVSGLNATNAGKVIVDQFRGGILLTNPTPGVGGFIQSDSFSYATATNAAIAAVQSLVGVGSSTSSARKIEIATLAAIGTLKDGGSFAAADGLTLYQLPLTGSLGTNGSLTGVIFLGADHPTNPFRHKWNPIERHGFDVTRKLTITFDSAPSGDATEQPGFGVNYLTGRYREDILGLHKPLGPNQDIGLITDGTIRIERVFNP